MPIIRDEQLDIISYSAEQTMRLGTRLGALLLPGDVVCLSGDMGAGKTVFASGIGKGWGASTPLTSPTFNLVHVHRRKKDTTKLYHLDCYRLSSVMDAESIDLDDILSGKSIALFEWPEHIREHLPAQRLWIEFRISEPTRRSFVFEGIGERYEKLITQFRGKTFGV
ncbi:MAG: tRNA (adenosine(37)-N6)-threonylcarbamoyltransferase complex ATPase subunit type 1 TsaE [Chloroflexota bacterium]|nr:tRNA (adenosine(37)-N6)-threonylcarbamoyltransferase complex ATPase subunit type 1 TsaE [Chloroflexota bacterium]